MAIDIHTPRFMIEMVRQMPPLRTFLRDTFFNQIKTFPTESVDFDIKKGGMAMAPFVNPRIGSTVLDRQGYRTMTYKPPLVAPKRVLTPAPLKSKSEWLQPVLRDTIQIMSTRSKMTGLVFVKYGEKILLKIE